MFGGLSGTFLELAEADAMIGELRGKAVLTGAGGRERVATTQRDLAIARPIYGVLKAQVPLDMSNVPLTPLSEVNERIPFWPVIPVIVRLPMLRGQPQILVYWVLGVSVGSIVPIS